MGCHCGLDSVKLCRMVTEARLVMLTEMAGSRAIFINKMKTKSRIIHLRFGNTKIRIIDISETKTK